MFRGPLCFNSIATNQKNTHFCYFSADASLQALADMTAVARGTREDAHDQRRALGEAVLYGEALEGRLRIMGEEGTAMGELVAAREALGGRAAAVMVLLGAEERERRLLGELKMDSHAAQGDMRTTFRPLGVVVCCFVQPKISACNTKTNAFLSMVCSYSSPQ